MGKITRAIGIAATAAAAGYVTYASVTWLRYGNPAGASPEEADALLDRFMPDYDVVERHSTFVHAPARTVLAAACALRLEDDAVARTLFRTREFLMGGTLSRGAQSSGMLDGLQAIGWQILMEVPGREIVLGAVTQPWQASPKFGPFTEGSCPGFVKIAFTLRADPATPATSLFRTETRALACGADARTKFRTYWALLSPGIGLIRRAMLGPVRREAERRFRLAGPTT